MKNILPIHPADMPSMLALVLATVCFCSFWLLFVSDIYKRRCYEIMPGDKGKIFHILSLKYIGFIMLGVIPAALFIVLVPGQGLTSIGLYYNAATTGSSLTWMTGIGLPLIVLMRLACKRPHGFERYPQIRVEIWDIKLLASYCLAWAVFMFGYEILFRGVLLFPLVDRFGVLPAIAINTLFYVGSHLPKGAAETCSSFVFGPLLCMITLDTGTVWAAGAIHVILAVANCILSTMYHPGMHFVKDRNAIPALPLTFLHSKKVAI